MKHRRLFSQSLSLAAVGLLGLMPSIASAQSVTNSSTTGTTSATLEVALSVSAAIQITIAGGTDGGDTTTLTVPGAASDADLAFGTVDSLCVQAPTTGACLRTETTAAHVIGTIDVTVAVSGTAAGANIGLERDAFVAGQVPAGDLKYATGTATDWAASASGTGISDVGAGTGTELGAGVASGTTSTHQLAVRIDDADVAASYSTTVTYTATAI